MKTFYFKIVLVRFPKMQLVTEKKADNLIDAYLDVQQRHPYAKVSVISLDDYNRLAGLR